MDPTIRVTGLEKHYGSTRAVDGISFEVHPGQVFCLLGPNGAGKTTTIECLEGYREPDAGEIRVLGLDPRRDQATLQHKIGVQLQEASLPARIRVWETLQLFSTLYELDEVPWHLLDQLGLETKRDTFFDKLSGGQKQRLFVALALINDPEVVFLDEITTGLDPQARQTIWNLIRGIRDAGSTVVMSTHFMDEAEALADRVAIMRSGRIVADDTPQNLMQALRGEDEVRLHIEGSIDSSRLEAIEGVASVATRAGGRSDSAISDGEQLVVRGQGRGWIARLVAGVDAQGAELVDLSTRRPTLEDVYLSLTGEEEYEPDPQRDGSDGQQAGQHPGSGGIGGAS